MASLSSARWQATWVTPMKIDRQRPRLPLAPPISVSLLNSQWVMILKLLTLYGQAHGDDDWFLWRQRVRVVLLGAVNRNTDESQPALAALPIEDWRSLWQCAKQVCDEGSPEQRRWLASFSREITQQIRSWKGIPRS